MKKKIHPKYKDAKAVCACGAVFNFGSTVNDDIKVEICSQCHPFYTGTDKVMDTAGRVDRFKRLQAKSVKTKA